MLIQIVGDGIYEVSDAEGERIRALTDPSNAATGGGIDDIIGEVRAIGVACSGQSAPDLVLTPSEPPAVAVPPDEDDDSDEAGVEDPLDEFEDASMEFIGPGESDGASEGLRDVDDTDRRFG